MSKENLFAFVESNEKILVVYGFMPVEECPGSSLRDPMQTIAEDFANGVEVKHEQVVVREKSGG
jgi:hypothetical protein